MASEAINWGSNPCPQAVLEWKPEEAIMEQERYPSPLYDRMPVGEFMKLLEFCLESGDFTPELMALGQRELVRAKSQPPFATLEMQEMEGSKIKLNWVLRIGGSPEQWGQL